MALFNPLIRYFWLFFFLIIKGLPLTAQEEPYFQQTVDYTIQATLDDERHELRGDWKLIYTNNSPDTLSFLYLHVWANAYKDRQTAFAKQLLDLGRLDFHFAKAEDLGGMIDEAFQWKVDGALATATPDPKHQDILKVDLPQPLLPGATVTLTTPFALKIPGNFSRLAHIEQSYYVCQWYPKPAVYDREGWHPMPYLNNGEFYSEFGKYDVTLTLPANYVVGATGTLQTPSEQAFMDSLAKAHTTTDWETIAYEPDPYPASAKQLKTIRYTAERVHDFAWFADKRFFVQQQKIPLASGKEVQNYVLFTKIGAIHWADSALVYGKRSLQFYSEEVGEYPYPTLTLVQANYRGNDMEYPMITVVNFGVVPWLLEATIAHEVGHNWFYGILGSNERDYPWIDEGMNTFYEEQYMEKHAPLFSTWDNDSYQYVAAERSEQPINTPSDSLTDDNYYICAYAKPALSFSYLQQYLGKDTLDRIIKDYYQTWQFKHPQPADLRRAFEQGTSKKLNWFFDHLIETNERLDYALTGHSCCQAHQQASVRLRNKGDFAAPVLISAIDEQDSIIAEQWVEALPKGQDTTLQLPEADRYWVDAKERMPEVNRNNNVVRSHGLFKAGKPLKLGLINNYYGQQDHKLFLLPLFGYNHYDGALIGATAYSLPLPRRPWHYAVAPMFTTATLSVVGTGEVGYHHHFGKHQLVLGARMKSFHRRRQDATEERPFRYAERYYKPSLFGYWDWAPQAAISPHRHQTGWSSALIGEEQAQLSRLNATTFAYNGKVTNWRSTHRLYHQYAFRRKPTTLTLKGELEYANYSRLATMEHYLQLTLEANATFWYSPEWVIELRGFAGGFLWHTNRQFGAFPLVLAAGNRKDYHYDQLLGGRQEQGNVLAQQVVIADGGFKVPLEEVQFLGASNTFLMAVNVTADLPFKLPFRLNWLKLRPFADVGYTLPSDPLSQGQDPAESIWVSAGLYLELADGLANIYVPLLETENLNRQIQSFTQGQWWRRITLSLHFNQLYTESTVKKWLY